MELGQNGGPDAEAVVPILQVHDVEASRECSDVPLPSRQAGGLTAKGGLGPLTSVALLVATFLLGGVAGTLVLWWHYSPLLKGQGPPLPWVPLAFFSDPRHDQVYCKRLLTLGDVGASNAERQLQPEPWQACRPLAGNSDVSVPGFELVAPYWRMIDILPTIDLPVDTVSFFCERASTIGVSVGIYGSDGMLVTSSGKTVKTPCADREWVDVEVPEVTLKAGEVYYIAHLHSSGTWFTARGGGNQFARTAGKHFYTKYEGSLMPLEQPASEAWGNGASDEAALVVKHCDQAGVKKVKVQAETITHLRKEAEESRKEDHQAQATMKKMWREQAALKEHLRDAEHQRDQLAGQLSVALRRVKAAEEERTRLDKVIASLGEVQRQQVQQEELTAQRQHDELVWWQEHEDKSTHTLQASEDPPKGRRFAYVMMSYTAPGEEEEIWGVLAVAAALRRLSQYPLVVLTNSTHFPDGSPYDEAFEKLGIQRLPVYRVDMPSQQLESGMLTARWKYAYWKLQIWKLTQFDKLIWLDSDTMVFRDIDWLFERTWMWAQRDDWFCKLDQTNVCSGVMLLEPNEQDFYGLLKYASTLTELTDGDQQLIMMYFNDVVRRPINLLSDLEASFGQCLGKADSPYLNADGSVISGSWSTPAVVHKSGGWGNTNNNEYANACFVPKIAIQLYTVGNDTINVCQYHPLGVYWRDNFCQVAHHTLRLNTTEVLTFCDDACWFRGVDRRPSDMEPREVWCVPNTTVDLATYRARVVGHPLNLPPQ